MAISIEDKKRKIKEKRSQALQQKINLLWARDGNDTPKIESSADDDDFNLYQLFGGSKSAQINWTQMGIEGLIRCYYEIIYKLNGTKRNNLITNNGEAPNGSAYSSNSYRRSDLTASAKRIMSGTAYMTGYYIGNATGFEGKEESDIDTNQDASRGAYDMTSSTFTHNRDKRLYIDTYNYEPKDDNQILGQIELALRLIGEKSPLGPHGPETFLIPPTPKSYTDYIDTETILGNRFADVTPGTVTGIGATPTVPPIPIPGTTTYGNGSYDFETNLTLMEDQSEFGGWTKILIVNPLDYSYTHRDYYDSSLDSALTNIKNILISLEQWINYTKIDYDNYFMNPDIIPGRTNNWSHQAAWLSSINGAISTIDTYFTNKSTANRLELDQLIIQLKETDLPFIRNTTASIVSEIESFFGTIDDTSKLYGFRVLWLKSLIDIQNGGSKITLQSLTGSVADADKKIVQSQESFGLIGVTLKDDPYFSSQKYWDGGIVDPIIGGIETHMTLDQEQYLDDGVTENPNYFTMQPDGLIIAWGETAHATAYTLYKSNDYDPTTEEGTWTALIPAGQSYTNENIDINTGKVLSYYIDYDVDFEAEENPYYKVKTFDTGRKSANDYWWYGATSDYSEPISASDFLSTPASGTNIPGMSGSASPSASDQGLPDYLFKYATIKMGGESTDSPINKVYTSDVEFDSIGSNLSVFVDGVLIEQSTGSDDYTLLNTTDIEFNTPINSNSKVTMIVYFGTNSSSGGSSSTGGNWKSPVNTLDQRPTINNANGDVILVLENNTLYSWDAAENNWYEISSTNDLSHTDLFDMPDSNGVNSDHDERYPRREEVESTLSEIQIQLNNLSFLVPENAAPLTSELTITNTPYITGYLSNGTNRFTTLEPETLYNRIVLGDDFVFESINKDMEFGDADKGTLTLFINNIQKDYINLESKFVEDDRNGKQSWTPFNSSIIELTSICAYNNYGQHQKCDFKLNVNKNDLYPGENKITLIHESLDFTRSSEFIFFWDSNPVNISFFDYEFNEHVIGTQKYLSGVRYYSINDQFNFKFIAAGMFDNTYLTTDQIQINTNEFGIEAYNINYTNNDCTADYINPVLPYNNFNIYYDGIKMLNKHNVYNISPTLKLVGKKPGRTSSEYTNEVPNILINTYNQMSDDKHEYFVDEIYRMPENDYDIIPSNVTYLWNSKNKLTIGQLMVYNQTLKYPNINFVSGYKPIQTTNYSGFEGEREYYRAFIDDGKPHNNGKFMIKGNTFNDDNIKIYMKLPNQTGWLDLKKPYNEAEFTGSEGDGCLLENNEYDFNWTSGGYSTAHSGYLIILRVIMSNSSANPIEEISINW